MTDRLNALIVVLEYDIRDDDAQPLIDAIGMMRGVISVTGNVSDVNDHVAKIAAKHELKQKLWEVLK